MRSLNLIGELNQNTDTRDTSHPLRVVIIYNGIIAGKRALRVMSELARNMGETIELQPSPWSFDLLADAGWAEMAADDAAHADILIIATHCTHPLPAAVGRWTESAIRRKQGTAAAVVALFGPEGNPDGPDSFRLEAIQTAASRADLEFFAPAARHPRDGWNPAVKLHLQ